MVINMKLKILERLLMLDILPKEGSFVTLKIVRKLREKVSFTEKEIKDFEITQNEKNVSWNIKIDSEIEKEFSDMETDMIKEKLKRLDDEKKLEEKHFTLYEKFIGG